MEPYEGDKPYIFISYSHNDSEKVYKCINILQQNMCYLWYDKGCYAGDDWAENIAEHLLGAQCFLVFISNNSVKSTNVGNELLMALNHKKHIIPVYIDDVKLPLGWEIKISHLHAIRINEEDFNPLLREIPKSVIKKTDSPFYKNERNSFYFLSEELKKDFIGKLSIICEKGTERRVIWEYQTPGPYELVPITDSSEANGTGEHPVLVNIQCQVKDDFFDMKGNGCVIFSVRIGLLLPYPLYGPDGDGIIIFAIIDPLGDNPRVRVLDSMVSGDSYRYCDKQFAAYEYDPFTEPPDQHIGLCNMLPKE